MRALQLAERAGLGMVRIEILAEEDQIVGEALERRAREDRRTGLDVGEHRAPDLRGRHGREPLRERRCAVRTPGRLGEDPELEEENPDREEARVVAATGPAGRGWRRLDRRTETVEVGLTEPAQLLARPDQHERQALAHDVPRPVGRPAEARRDPTSLLEVGQPVTLGSQPEAALVLGQEQVDVEADRALEGEIAQQRPGPDPAQVGEASGKWPGQPGVEVGMDAGNARANDRRSRSPPSQSPSAAQNRA